MDISPSTPDTTIVMATYNGEKYVGQQIDSIIQQTYTHWCLLIRDDGSTDNTVQIIKQYAERYPQITILEDRLGNLGFNKNFITLIQAANSPYISICDQDDVWLPEKLALNIEAIKRIEITPQIPALVHSDAWMVDSNLNLMHAAWIGKRGEVQGLNGIAFANSVQGATVLFNQALKTIAVSVPIEVPYDYHLALLAVFKGKRHYLNLPLLKYRQHSQNAIGSGVSHHSKRKLPHYLRQLFDIARQLTHTLDYSQLTPTLKYSLDAYHRIKYTYSRTPIVADQNKALEEYLYLFEGQSKIKKIYLYIKNNYPFSSKKDRLIFLLLLLTSRDLSTPTSW